MKPSHNKILITGGASGIGLAMAERFAKEDNTVIICGRRTPALVEAKARIPSLITRQCDLSVSRERASLFDWISKEHGDLNVLVNNAGIQQWMTIGDPDFYRKASEEITINAEAPVHLASLFVMLKSPETIINVTSGLSFVPLIKVPVYCATKAFLHSFTLSLREQVKLRKIEVIEVIPPALNTDLGGKGIHDHAPPVGDFIESVFTQLKEGKTEIAFGFSASVYTAGQEVLRPAFARMNQLT